MDSCQAEIKLVKINVDNGHLYYAIAGYEGVVEMAINFEDFLWHE